MIDVKVSMSLQSSTMNLEVFDNDKEIYSANGAVLDLEIPMLNNIINAGFTPPEDDSLWEAWIGYTGT